MSNRIDVAGLKGLKWDDFTAMLNENHIDLVIDCRDNPNPRWTPFFCKAQMRDGLAIDDIEYRHEKILGNPKPGKGIERTRQSFQECGRMDEDAFIKALHRIIEEVQADRGVCLLCYCDEYDACHLADIIDRLCAEFEAHAGRQLGVDSLNQAVDPIANSHLLLDEEDNMV